MREQNSRPGEELRSALGVEHCPEMVGHRPWTTFDDNLAWLPDIRFLGEVITPRRAAAKPKTTSKVIH